MLKSKALTIRQGDKVRYGGRIATVNSIRTSGIAGPYFRLTDEKGEYLGLLSHRLVTPIAR